MLQYSLLIAGFVFISLLVFNNKAETQNIAAIEKDIEFNGLGTLLVANKGEDSVSFIDLKSGREIGRRPTGKNPHEIALSPDGKKVAIVSYGASNIDIFDVQTKNRLENIDLGHHSKPHGIVWLKDGRILATTEGSDNIIILSAPDHQNKRILSAIATEQKGSHMLAVDQKGHFAFVANLQSASITKIDLKLGQIVGTVPTGAGTEGIAITPDGKQVYVSAREANLVTILDSVTLEKLDNIPVGRFPLRVIISPDGKYAVTSNMQDGNLSVIDTKSRKFIRNIKVSGQGATGQVTILFSIDGKYIYVAETGIDRVAEIDFTSGKLLGRLPAGKNGDGLAIAPH